jgi:hypothetical protein
MAMTRQALADELARVQPRFQVQWGTHDGKDKRTAYLVLDRAIGERGPEWNSHQETLRNFKLLAWTSKMDAPSFSLPAGTEEVGGACPGAKAGQSTVPPSERNFVSVSQIVQRLQPIPAQPGTPEWLAGAICDHCLTGDTRVFVRDRGLVRLDEIALDTEIEVWSGVAWRKTRLVEQGVREVVELRSTWGHRITLTPDHKVLTDEGMVAASELEPGMNLASIAPSSNPFPADAPLPAFPPEESPYHTSLTEHVPTVWSNDVGYVLGAILGDGHVGYRKYPTVGIMSAIDQREVTDRVHRVIGSWYDTDSRVVVSEVASRDNGLIACGAPQPRVKAVWRIQRLVAFLDVLGLDKRPRISDRRVPHSIWTASKAGVAGFLAGLFDTDGSVARGPRKIEVSLAATSHGLLEDVQQLLLAFGIRSTICEYRNAWRVEGGYERLWKLGINSMESVRRFAAEIGFCVDVKHTKLHTALAALTDVGYRPRQPRVAEVRATTVHEPVYDLVNVGTEHHFVANGLVVSNCYAEGGNYAYSSKQLAAMLIFAWTKQALADGTFVPVMTEVIGHADFLLEGQRESEKARLKRAAKEGEAYVDVPRWNVTAESPRYGRRFFRIHDSGDFFSARYLAAWKQVADALSDIVFWAPTRIWATPWGIDAVNRVNASPRNLIIRPSAYHINTARLPELGPGWAQPSTVFDKTHIGEAAQARAFDWNCPAYDSQNENHSCRSATAPDHQQGCRACWVHPEMAVNYKLH